MVKTAASEHLKRVAGRIFTISIQVSDFIEASRYCSQTAKIVKTISAHSKSTVL
jgi:hypothetical protein